MECQLDKQSPKLIDADLLYCMVVLTFHIKESGVVVHDGPSWENRVRVGVGSPWIESLVIGVAMDSVKYTFCTIVRTTKMAESGAYQHSKCTLMVAQVHLD